MTLTTVAVRSAGLATRSARTERVRKKERPRFPHSTSIETAARPAHSSFDVLALLAGLLTFLIFFIRIMHRLLVGGLASST